MVKINLNLDEIDPEIIEFLFCEQLRGLPIKEVEPWRKSILRKVKKDWIN
ncbi:hypothetical protein HYT58_03075 [Candidatus Woesearchaeota archaeon]|nr:hypothetical protein [Candidatus Woesearchaeota archaeon]